MIEATPQRWFPPLLAGVFGLAAVLRFMQLDSQLWLDEISALESSIRRPFWVIATEWPGPASHVLFELLARISVLVLGESPFAVRLPAALLGLGSVVVLYVFTRRTLPLASALVGTGLFAVSYHHVFFSQNARGYTALIFFGLLAATLLRECLHSGTLSLRRGVWYVIALTATAYSQPFGVFVPVAHAVIVLGLVAWPGSLTRRPPWRPLLLSGAATAVATGVLYAPLLGDMLTHAAVNVQSEAEGPRFGSDLVLEVVEGLSAASYGSFGLAVAGVIGFAGFWSSLRRDPLLVLLLLLPLASQAVVFWIAGVGVHPRYFALALPAVMILGGHGVALTLQRLSRFVPVLPVARQRGVAVALAVFVTASAQPLLRYYQYPKQDFLGALALVEERAVPADQRLGLHSSGSVLGTFYNGRFKRIETLPELLAAERRGGRIFMVTTVERVLAKAAPDLLAYVRQNYRQLERFPGTVGDGTVVVHVRDLPAHAE